MKKHQLFQMVILLSGINLSLCCTTSGPDSSWEDLQNTQDVKCSKIEYTNSIIGVREVKDVDSSSGIFVEGIARSGKISYYEAPVGKYGPDAKLKQVSLSERSLSGVERFISGGNKYYAYVGEDLKVKVVTDSDSKVVEYPAFDEVSKCSEDEATIEGVKVQSSGGSVWISVVSRCSDKLNMGVALIDIGVGAVVKSFFQPGIWDSYNEWIVTDNADLLVVTSSPEEEASDFYIYKFTTDGLQENYSIKIKEHVENWSSIFKNGQLYLATVQGDSMVGEATINVDKFKLEARATQNQNNNKDNNKDNNSVVTTQLKSALTGGTSVPLAHLSAPVWLDKGTGLGVLLFKWLDNEATVGSYIVEENGSEGGNYSLTLKMVDLGVFPNGSKIEKTYVVGDKEFMVIKTQSNYFGEYSICRLN